MLSKVVPSWKPWVGERRYEVKIDEKLKNDTSDAVDYISLFFNPKKERGWG